MAKELPYFRLNCQEWQNSDVSLESMATQGLFINICCYYWMNNCDLKKSNLIKKFKMNNRIVKELFKNNLLRIDNDNICIDFMDQQWQDLKEFRLKKQIAGAKGGKQKSSNAKAKLKHNSSYKENYKDKEKEKDNKREKFRIPTITQIDIYCKNRKNSVSAEKFWHHYHNRDWKLKGGGKMKSWQSSVITWEENNYNKNSDKPTQFKTVGDKQDELLEKMEKQKEARDARIRLGDGQSRAISGGDFKNVPQLQSPDNTENIGSKGISFE